MATCFDSVETSSGLPKNRSNVSKFYSAFCDPKRIAFGIPECIKFDYGRSPHAYVNQRLQIQFGAPDDERYAARNMLSLQ
jgi:hypothetical protein